MLWNFKHYLKKGLPWLPIIKELYLIHAPLLKNLRYTQKVQFKDRYWRHANFVIWVAAILDLPKMGFKGVAKFEPHDLSQFHLFWYDIHPNWIWGSKSRQPFSRASRIFSAAVHDLGSKSAALYCMRKGLLVISISCDSQWLMHKMIKWSSKMIFNFNTLWPSDAIWWHRSVLTLARITACSWWQQAITWSNVDLSSVGSTEICLWAIS